MNLLCKMGYHKWKYDTQRMVINPMEGENWGLDDIEMDCTIRLCDKCCKKEINRYRGEWRKTKFYTKEEKRDMKLKILIGKDV